MQRHKRRRQTVTEISTIPIAETFKEVSSKKQLNHEYAVGSYLYGSPLIHGLPRTLDELEREAGPDIYARMMLDDAVMGAIRVLKKSILATGFQIRPAVDSDHPDFDFAKILAEFAARVISNMSTPFLDVCNQMLDSLPYGHKVAEIIYRQENMRVEDRGLLIIDKIKVKPKTSYNFVVDRYYNVLGIAVNEYGWGGADWNNNGYIMPLSQADSIIPISRRGKLPTNVIPRSKIWVHTHDKCDEDPRGQSILRAAYGMWYFKQRMIDLWQVYAEFFSNPSYVGVLPENAVPFCVTDQNGNILQEIPAAEHYAHVLSQLRNASAIVLPFGSKVEVIQAQSNASDFESAILLANKSILTAITGGNLTLSSGGTDGGGSQGAASAHQGSMDSIVQALTDHFEESIRNDVLRILIQWNYGPEAAKYLTPYVNFGPTMRYAQLQLINAYLNEVEGSGSPEHLEEEANENAAQNEENETESKDEKELTKDEQKESKDEKSKSKDEKSKDQDDKKKGRAPVGESGAITRGIQVARKLAARTTDNRRLDSV